MDHCRMASQVKVDCYYWPSCYFHREESARARMDPFESFSPGSNGHIWCKSPAHVPSSATADKGQHHPLCSWSGSIKKLITSEKFTSFQVDPTHPTSGAGGGDGGDVGDLMTSVVWALAIILHISFSDLVISCPIERNNLPEPATFVFPSRPNRSRRSSQ